MDEEMTKSEEQHLTLQKALQQCELVQNMIDISISSLEGLRTKCATSNDLTQQEIRTLEVSSIRVENDNILRCILTTKINMGLSRLPVSLRGHGVHIVLGIFSLITCVNPWSTGGGAALRVLRYISTYKPCTVVRGSVLCSVINQDAGLQWAVILQVAGEGVRSTRLYHNVLSASLAKA